MYLTYEEYKKMGGNLDETAFDYNICRATAIIDNATFKRVANMNVVPEQVKLLCRDLVNYLANNPSSDKTLTSKSQTSGPVNESESYKIKTKEEQESEINALTFEYLFSVDDDNGTPLLYRGCSF